MTDLEMFSHVMTTVSRHISAAEKDYEYSQGADKPARLKVMESLKQLSYDLYKNKARA